MSEKTAKLELLTAQLNELADLHQDCINIIKELKSLNPKLVFNPDPEIEERVKELRKQYFDKTQSLFFAS